MNSKMRMRRGGSLRTRLVSALCSIVGLTLARPATAVPPTWNDRPYPVKLGGAAVTMTATSVPNPNGTQYYFENTDAPARNSGWIDVPSWSDFGLGSSTAYSYRFKARDASTRTETEWSTTSNVTTYDDNTWAGFTPAQIGDRIVPFDFTGVRNIPHIPPTGVHPRIFFGPEELPLLRTRLVGTASGREAMAQVHAYNMLLKLGYNGYNRNADYAKDAYGNPRIGNVGYSDSSAYYRKLVAGDRTAFDGADNKRRNILASAMAMEALECLVYQGQPEYDARARSLAAAMGNWAALVVDDPLLKPGNDDFFGGVHMAETYDLNYNAMTTAQRDIVRQCIARTIWTRNMLYGIDTAPYATTSNWATLNNFNPIKMMSIEGEPGYNASLFRDNMRAIYNFITYGWYDVGAPYEGLGKGAQFVGTMIAFARRDYNLLGHPHVRAFGATYLPQIMQPYGFAFSEYDDWGGSGNTPVTGNYKFNIDDALGLKWAFPSNPSVDFMWRNYIGSPGDPRPYIYQPYRPDGLHNELLVAVILASDFQDGDWQTQNIAALQGRLTLFAPERGLLITRSDFSQAAMELQLQDRQDMGGHTHADRNNFTLSALGRLWAVYRTGSGGGPTGTIAETKYHTGVLIDDRGIQVNGSVSRQPGKVVSVVDQAGATFVAGDARNAYSWEWNWSARLPGQDNSLVRQGWQKVLETPNDSRLIPNNEFFDNLSYYDRAHWNQPGYLEGYVRRPSNPVQRAYRTAGVVRGMRPYALVMDDYQKDGGVHNYKWLMQLANDLSIETIDVNLDPMDYRSDVILKEGSGDRRLLVRVLTNDGAVDPNTPAVLDSVSDPRTPSSLWNRLIVESNSVAPQMKVLLFPFMAGDPLPVTTVAEGVISITIGDDTDELDYQIGPDGRTHYVLWRDGNFVIADP